MDQTALPSSLDPFFSASLIHQNSAGIMHTIADFCVVPMGVTASVSQYVAECQRVLEKSGMSGSYATKLLSLPNRQFSIWSC
jgi:hypothetical protein